MTAEPSKFKQAVFAMQRGENGEWEYTDSGIGSDILALSQRVRGGEVEDLCRQVLKRGDPTEIAHLAELIFVTRNARGGKGEKQLSYNMFLEFAKKFPQTSKDLLKLFPLYGYWKDLFLLMEAAGNDHPDLIDEAFKLVHEQWNKDLAALAAFQKSEENGKKKGPSISLLAKWLPREGKALDKAGFVKRFVKMAYPSTENTSDSWKSASKSKYRKQVAEMTSYLQLPEVLLAAERADEIEMGRVASKATKLYTRAFLYENKAGSIRGDDPKRLKLRDKFLDEIVEKGLKGKQVMPHEIVKTIYHNHKISGGMELALDAQWKDMWKGVVEQVQVKAAEDGMEFNPTRMVPLSDVSGSMEGTPMEVSIALGIGLSEITHPAFKDMVMTFSAIPEWHKLNPDDTIVKKVRSLARADWGGNTNFEKAYDLILEICVSHKLRREDVPCLIVFSDMQFDEAAGNYGSNKGFQISTMFETIREKFRKVAEQLGWEDAEPSPIVFWNLRNAGGHPVSKDTPGTVLLSGFSPSLLKLVMNGEALKETEVEVVQEDGTVVKEKVQVTPEEVLLKMLSDRLYDPVRRVLGRSKEGPLAGYVLPDIEGDLTDEFEMVEI